MERATSTGHRCHVGLPTIPPWRLSVIASRQSFYGSVLQVLLIVVIMISSPCFAQPSPNGKLMLFGGAERDNNPLLWEEFVRVCGGKGAKVAIFPTASTYPERTGSLFHKHMTDLGLDPFIVPLGEKWPGCDVAAMVQDASWVSRIEKADAVFLAGGEQLRYRRAFVNEQGETPMLRAIRSVYQRGGAIAGTSAGTAVMSRIMFIDAEKILPVLVNGAHMGKQVDHGLGLLPHDWFVDQHFLTRGRFGRTLVAMQSYDFAMGLGIDEDSAIVLDHERKLKVMGYRGAVIVDARQATRDSSEPRFHWKGLRLSFLSHGDEFDLSTMQSIPGPDKRDEDRIDPKSKTFKPYYLLKQFYNDIFANTQLLDLMYKLVDSPHNEAIGLAFDGESARKGNTPGFEFRFYRGEDTVSWDAPVAKGDPNTVLNVYLTFAQWK